MSDDLNLARNTAATLAGLVAGYRREGDDFDGAALVDALTDDLPLDQAVTAVLGLALAAARQLAATEYVTPDEDAS